MGSRVVWFLAAAVTVAAGAWLLGAAGPANAASAAPAGPLYHHPDHDDLGDVTFVPKSAVTETPETGPADPASGGDLPPGAGRIIGSPDPGPEPQHSGDRGGWRQLALMGALTAAVAVIMGRVLLAARNQQDQTGADRPQPTGAATGAET